MFFLEFLLIIILITAAYAGFRAAPWWPTHQADLKRILTLLDIQPGQTICELGCGDGRFLVELAKNTPAQKIIGYEISVLFYLIARWRSRNYQTTRVEFRDFWNTNLCEADFVYVFLTPRIHERLRKKLENELKPGAKIICYTWPIDGWEPIHIDQVPGRTLYVYQRPS